MSRARHHPLPTPRRDFLRHSLGWALAVAPLPLFATTPEEIAHLTELETRMRGLDDLGKLAHATGHQADTLAVYADVVRDTWAETLRLQAQINPAIDAARTALTQLDTELQAGDLALQAQMRAAADSRTAAIQLASSANDPLGQTATAADTAFTRRRQADAALAAQQNRIGAAANAGAGALRNLRELIAQTLASAKRVNANSQQMRSHLASLREASASTIEAARKARSAGWFTHTTTAPDLPDGQAIARLCSALGTPPAAGEPPANGITQLFEHSNNSAAAAAALAREEDAASVRQLMAEQCSADACATLRAEQAERLPDLEQAQTALTALQARLTALRQQLPATLDAPQAQMVALRNWLAGITPLVSPALDEASGATSRVRAVTTPLAASADAAFREARAAWIDAYRAAYGSPPPEPAMAEEFPSTAAAPPPPRPTAAHIQLRSHAYEWVSTLDGERRGFGAYTYVLLRSGRDLDSPSVARRYTLLLDLLEGELPEAASISDKQAANVNLFCIPTRPADAAPSHTSRPPYGAALACQWLLNAQHGLLTRKEILVRLIRSPAPSSLPFPPDWPTPPLAPRCSSPTSTTTPTPPFATWSPSTCRGSSTPSRLNRPAGHRRFSRRWRSP